MESAILDTGGLVLLKLSLVIDTMPPSRAVTGLCLHCLYGDVSPDQTLIACGLRQSVIHVMLRAWPCVFPNGDKALVSYCFPIGQSCSLLFSDPPIQRPGTLHFKDSFQHTHISSLLVAESSRQKGLYCVYSKFTLSAGFI